MSDRCRNCGLEAGANISVAIEESLWKVNIFVCKKCFINGRDEEYSMMTMSSAMEEYGLSAQDLTGSHFSVIKKPTSYGKNSYMKLYYKFQVEEAAIKKYGTIENAKVESENIKERRMQNRIDKKFGILKRNKKKEDKIRRKKIKIEAENKRRQKKIDNYHKHEYGDPVNINGSNNVFLKKCKECDFELTWEEV
ncbi:RAD14/XpA [Cryptosporidium ryanae]|uniref:RAD14/XpA n=1 Tax=Cryptosporidium ryanae TaxID=515981 RepID=UPI003519F803|nr:RAD14/XpA [Cryptosporidium ryanae]